MPILITINSDLSTIDGPRQNYINFKNADWARYVETGEKYLAEAGETRTVELAEKTFRKAVNKVSGLFIPVGRIQHFQPTLPASAKSLADERDRICGLNPADEALNDLDKQIQKLAAEDKRTKWQSATDKCDHRTGTSHLWRLVKGLSGKLPHNSPNNGVRFVDKAYLDPKMIANKLAHQFTQPRMHLTGDKSKRQLKRQFYQPPLTATPSFTPADQNEAIRLAKSSTANRPDRMSTLHLMKLAQCATYYLTNIFNLSISKGQIPQIWHKAIIMQILILGKDNNIGKNWRQISIQCPATKTLEKLLLPKIQLHIPFHPAQYGLRPKNSTCTALSTITADIAAGFSRKIRLTEQCSSRSGLQLHSTMWTINNCSIVSSAPTYRQRSVAGSATICRIDEPMLNFGKKNLRAERRKQEWNKEELYLLRSSITMWSTFQHRLRKSSRSSSPMTLPSTHSDQWWLI